MISLLTAIQAIAIGLLPLALTFWYQRDLAIIHHPRIYFTYSDAIIFASDGLALIIVFVWGIKRLQRLPKSPPLRFATGCFARLRKSGAQPDTWLLGICTLAILSITWSLDWRISLHISLHLWLVFGLYLSLRDTPQAWRWFSFGCCAALAIQTAIAIAQFSFQSTSFTMDLGLEWPGDLTPQISGASVVQLADGARWLRAYGTLPHPNILGGFALVFIAAP
ncbi:MAG: hypothetical protein HZC38_21050, partial [Chloroflexi bacterium]|nr:hypothetical protein [Chloroflexota bacterium]